MKYIPLTDCLTVIDNGFNYGYGLLLHYIYSRGTSYALVLPAITEPRSVECHVPVVSLVLWDIVSRESVGINIDDDRELTQ